MAQTFPPERIFTNSIDQSLIPLDPNKPAYNNQSCDECEDEVVQNIQDILTVYPHDAITDVDLKVKVANRGTLQEFVAILIADLNIKFE